jgi:hypothetical protein
MSDHYRQWSQFAPGGLVLIGLGISVIGDAVLKKSARRGWFTQGTLGLMLLNAGLAVFGEAVKHRTLYEYKTESIRGERE